MNINTLRIDILEKYTLLKQAPHKHDTTFLHIKSSETKYGLALCAMDLYHITIFRCFEQSGVIYRIIL